MNLSDRKRPQFDKVRARVVAAWLVALGAVAVSSLLADLAPPSAGIGLDKMIHFAVYLGLAAVPAAMIESKPLASCAVLSVLILGLGVEYGQSFLPGREASAMDGLADAIGICVGSIFGIHLRPRLGLMSGRVR